MKVFKYVLMFMLIACTMALAGCGGDKFAGKWYAINDNQRSISMLDITKNGENYIIKDKSIYYKADYKEVGKAVGEREGYRSPFDLRKVKYQFEIPVYEVTLNLFVENNHQSTQVENKGQLGEYTYIEKDKTLQGMNSMGKVITYKQGDVKDLIKKMHNATAAYYDKAKAGEVHISVKGIGEWSGATPGNKIKDYKFNENIPKDLE